MKKLALFAITMCFAIGAALAQEPVKKDQPVPQAKPTCTHNHQGCPHAQAAEAPKAQAQPHQCNGQQHQCNGQHNGQQHQCNGQHNGQQHQCNGQHNGQQHQCCGNHEGCNHHEADVPVPAPGPKDKTPKTGAKPVKTKK